MITRMRRLGVDIGGVIIEPADGDADTSFFGAHYLRTPVVHGAFDALAALGPAFDEVHLVSKCGEATERRTREWLAHHDFAARTGIPVERLHFCRTRPDKAPIAERLGLTHFVDDKLEVLGYLTSVPHRFLFRPRPAEVAARAALLPLVHRVESWPELTSLLRAD
ncbi:hypothetical protein O7631_16090 [Micromonospora sp. WMMD967]|uniref:hypothetical protein n=1 Tax=Micromonospora sp. WMMD967 TaxID=3016101 RepID=UPI002415B94D|nr:hypothetical protein [Micromonospora sp. WMMD967]MDG4838041.1 hypothetical protein [Micromonospora sp. WMMD967]